VLHQRVALVIHHPHHTISWNFKGLVMGAVFLGLLRHETDIGHTAHGHRIKRPVFFAVGDHFLENTRVAAVGNNGLGVVQLAIRPPHHARLANHRWH